MIRASELRIGNKIRMGQSQMVNTVFDISDNTRRGKFNYESDNHRLMYSHLMTVEENGNQYKPFEIDGVPLTEDWLLKFGFERVMKSEFKTHQMPYWAKDGVLLFYNESPPFNTYLACYGEWISDFKGGGEYICTGKRWIEYVHQLQNLYNALTENELTTQQVLQKP